MIIWNHPLLVLVISMMLLWGASRLGIYLRGRSRLDRSDDADLTLVTGAVLTLLGLLIGFSFSMAVSRYDQRKNYEEEEANAIGTEYLRAGLLPAESAGAVRELLKQYLEERLAFYNAGHRRTDAIDAETARLENAMWEKVQEAGIAQPTQITALVVMGMNDVLNRHGYTQAAWWNRIPEAAWGLMVAISVGCCVLVGYTVHRKRGVVLLIVPLAVSISFMLIADIDGPTGGMIRVAPQNLTALSRSMQGQ